jgi:large subunit ribosomal protein L21
MYAVIETGGKQYRVEVGTELEVELLDVEPGAAMKFERVLLVADGETASIGQPVVTNAEVAATVIGRARGVKTISFKYRPKARRRVKKGHRQELTLLRISDIVLDGHSAAADVQEADAARQRDRAKLEEAARRQAAADAELAAKLAAEKPAKAAPVAESKARAGRGAGGAAKAAEDASSAQATVESKPRAGGPKRGKAAATGAEAAASSVSTDKASAKTGPESQNKPNAKANAEAAASDKAPAKRRTKKES